MLWFLDYEITRWFLAFCLFAVAVSVILIAIQPWRNWIKVLLIVVMSLQLYPAMLLTDAMLGKPKPNSPEFNGTVAGYTVFQNSDQKKMIAILVRSVHKDRPLTISVPWTDQAERQLSQAMADAAAGRPTGIRQKNTEESVSEIDTGTVELYSFTDQMLVEKSR